VIAWEITRASAFVAFGCYTLSVTWGILVASRTLPAPAKPEFDYHRFLSSLGLTATAVHIVTVLIHHANGVHWPALFYVGARPAAIAGVTAMWLIVLLPVSFAAKRRKRLSTRAWRRLHYLGYAVWAVSLLHALGAGTDTRTRAGLAGYGLAAGVVATAAVWRLVSRRPAPARARRPPEPAARPQVAAIPDEQAAGVAGHEGLSTAGCGTEAPAAPVDEALHGEPHRQVAVVAVAEPEAPPAAPQMPVARDPEAHQVPSTVRVPPAGGAGADARTRPGRAGYGLAAGVVVTAAVWKLLSRRAVRAA
jgi:hypothetical protein